MHGSSKCKVSLDVPFQAGHLRSLSTKPATQEGMVEHLLLPGEVLKRHSGGEKNLFLEPSKNS